MKIVHYPHPALRHPAKPLSCIDKDLHLTIGRMKELMYEAKGLGLAAPQVALPYQLLVQNVTGDPTKPEQEEVFLNPVIVERRGIIEDEEGCLSFPGLFQNVRRAKTVRVKAYNLMGQLSTMTYPSKKVVTTTYDGAGRISGVVAGATAYATLTTTPTQGLYAYAENGAIQALTLGNGVVESTTFNTRFQPLGITAAKGSGPLLSLGFSWGASASANNGNLMSETIQTPAFTAARQNFTYDACNRLNTAMEGSAWAQSYCYDQFGNRGATTGSAGVFRDDWSPSLRGESVQWQEPMGK